MSLAQRISRLEATPANVPVPDRRDPYAMRAFAEGLVRADWLEGHRRLAALVWAMRGRQELAEAASKGDLGAVEAAFATVTEVEREGMRAATELMLIWLEARRPEHS